MKKKIHNQFRLRVEMSGGEREILEITNDASMNRMNFKLNFIQQCGFFLVIRR